MEKFETLEIEDVDEELKYHFNVVRRCMWETKNGVAVYATFPTKRYPYVYPRDTASCMRYLYYLHSLENEEYGEIAFKLMEGISKFILSVQSASGRWHQRYSIDGKNMSIYKQEDNTAHGMYILLQYLITAKERGEEVENFEEIVEAIEKASKIAMSEYFRREIQLYFSNTSIHESGIVRGYDIWTNFAYLNAFRKLIQFSKLYDLKERFRYVFNHYEVLHKSVFQKFTSSERFVRRITPTGLYDYNPDITLISPFYFGFENVMPTALDNSVQFAENELLDPELGGLQRYLPFTEDPNVHVHGGNGPWVMFTLMFAQYHYSKLMIERGDEILNWARNFSSEEGYLPEHLSTPERFEEFLFTEWETGVDYQKEFDPEILLPGIKFDVILEELNNMKREYDGIKAMIESSPGLKYVVFASPLMWSHAEFSVALLIRKHRKTLH